MKWLLKKFKKTLKAIVLDILGNVVRETVEGILERVQIPSGKETVKLATPTIQEIANKIQNLVERSVEDRLNNL